MVEYKALFEFLSSRFSKATTSLRVRKHLADNSPCNLRRGGGGGLFDQDHQIIDHNSKTALSSTSQLGDF